MSKVLSLFLLAMLTYASAISVAQSACQYIVKSGSIYNFYGFLEINTTYTTDDLLGDEGSINFDLCSPDITGCAANAQATAIAFPNVNTTDGCQNLADTRAPNVSYFNEDDPHGGVVLTYPVYSNGSVSNMLVIQVTCNADIAMKDISWVVTQSNTDGTEVYTLKGDGAPGCPIFTIESYLKFFDEYKILFATIFLLIGLFALLAGLRFFNITIFIFAAIIMTATLFVLILTFTGLEISTGAQWGIFVGCLLIGLGCGYGAVKLEKAGFFALGALFGGMGALFLYGLLLHFFNVGVAVLYVIIVIFALIGGGLALWLWKDIIIISTSCIGSYMIIRALSFYIGGFPSEIAVVQGVEDYDYIDYIYLAAMVFVAFGGMVFQFRRKRRDAENDKEIQSDIENTLNETVNTY